MFKEKIEKNLQENYKYEDRDIRRWGMKTIKDELEDCEKDIEFLSEEVEKYTKFSKETDGEYKEANELALQEKAEELRRRKETEELLLEVKKIIEEKPFAVTLDTFGIDCEYSCPQTVVLERFATEEEAIDYFHGHDLLVSNDKRRGFEIVNLLEV